MLTALPADLADLLARLEAAGGEPLMIDAEEAAALPSGLATQGVVERASAAASIVCPGCEEACVMPVHVRQGADREPVAFVACDKRADMGRVQLPLSRLDRWQMTPRTLAQGLAAAFGVATAASVAEGWRVGWVQGAGGRAEVLLDAALGVLQIKVAGHSLPIAEVLTWSDGRLGLDVPALMRLAAAPASGAAPESPGARAERLCRRKAELKRAGVGDFVKRIATEEGISETRVKQIIRAVESTGSAAPADPFAALGARFPRAAPVSPPVKRKR